MFTSDDEWGHDGACMFIPPKQAFTTLANPRRLAGFDEFKQPNNLKVDKAQPWIATPQQGNP
jgi:hypothetical protein